MNGKLIKKPFKNFNKIVLTKNFNEDYQSDFESLLEKSEAIEVAAFRKFLNREYNKGIDSYLQSGKVTGWDALFNETQIAALYVTLYRNIGLRFSKLYYNTFNKVNPTNINPNNYRSIWEDAFRNVGKKISDFRGASVSSTQQRELTKFIERFHRSPEFQKLNERQAGRILRSQVKDVSEWRSKLIVRTEATNAANFANMQTSLDMYGKDNLEKTWLTSFVRSRDSHISANNQKRKFDEMFFVGGEYLSHPGSGSLPANNCNCGCLAIFKPI